MLSGPTASPSLTGSLPATIDPASGSFGIPIAADPDVGWASRSAYLYGFLGRR